MNLRIENITKNYIRGEGDTNIFSAIKNASIDIECGKMVIIRGKSGSGKSTLLNVISGILPPDEGHVYIDNNDLYLLDDNDLSVCRNTCFGIIPQIYSGLFSLCVYDNIYLPRKLLLKNFNGINKNIKNEFLKDIINKNTDENQIKETDTFILDLIKKFDLTSLLKEYPENLSGGEMRRMSFVRAFVNNPDIIMADEPTGDLDNENTMLVFKTLREYADSGKIVLIVTHENIGDEYADFVYSVNDGNLEINN